MGRLWIYGDSYSASFEYLLEGVIPWTAQVAKKLKLDIVYKAKHGSSIDYMIHESINDAAEYKEDDTCIFVITELHRAWLIANDPASSYPTSREYDVDHHANLRKSYLVCWLHAIENYTKHCKLRPLVIPAWDPKINYKPTHLGWASGELFQSSLDEIIFPNNNKVHPNTECRLNHLTLPNHKLLSEMVCDWFVNQTEVDCCKLHKEVIPLSAFLKIDNSKVY